ncbi:group III truncated hemoglobin [Hyphomonas sp. WL0036]|uniref:group III truncated hemoglobin n=1 Tax=Hyphomonas sediminis TaxID=2866160 RepID=UPI001C7EFE03|nr:group III truncated hemoglobin [Hyphomonas sediminis]MBY9067977.1 group III truncated hemoglobin [Hyphomonas sediminis]
MTGYRVRSAEERRQELRDQAAALGVTEDYISTLVDTFYTRVRAHPVLGPVFDVAISDWGPHLDTMKDFWSSVALGTGRYSGRPVPAHAKHRHIQQFHFNLWLALFEQTLRDTATTPEAATFFMERANRIAQSLQYALFGLESLPVD